MSDDNVAESHPALVGRLHKLADTFDYKSILNILKHINQAV